MMGFAWECALGQNRGLWLLPLPGESQARDVADGPFPRFLGSRWDPNVLAVYLAHLPLEKVKMD